MIPVARNVWQHVDAGSPAADARRLIIASTAPASGRPFSRPARSTLWNSGAFASSMPAAATYASSASSARW